MLRSPPRLHFGEETGSASSDGQETLGKFAVPAPERGDVLGFVESFEKDIVD